MLFAGSELMLFADSELLPSIKPSNKEKIVAMMPWNQSPMGESFKSSSILHLSPVVETCCRRLVGMLPQQVSGCHMSQRDTALP